MRVNTSWAFVGNAIYAACQWAVLILLVNALPAADVGQFAYGLAITGPVFVFANVRLRDVLATGVHSPGDFHDYLTARLLTTAAAIAVSIAAGALLAPGGPAAIVTLVACAKGCDAVSEISHGLFQRELDMRTAAIGLMLNGCVSVLLVAFVLFAGQPLAVAAAAYAAGSLFALAAWDLPQAARRLKRIGIVARPSVDAARALVARALPLGMSSAIGSVQSNLPRYVVAATLGPGALAVFAALSYIPLIGHTAVNAAVQSALPLLAREAQGPLASYQRRLVGLVAASAGVGTFALLAMVLFGRSLLGLIYGDDYAAHVSVLLWLMVATVVTFTSVFLGAGITARGRFKTQLAITTTSLAVVAGSIWPLVRLYGLSGAAVSLLVAAIVELAAYATLTVRDFRTADKAPALVTGALAGSVGR
jgi:O-antigen/teichoic acid export membrane protein